MPYYSWLGINLQGELIDGNRFARSIKDLDSYLFNQEISLIKVKKSIFSFFYQNVPKKLKLEFINNTAILLKSNIRLSEALSIVYQSIQHKYFKEIVNDIKSGICEGLSLNYILQAHKSIFDEITISAIAAGESSSELVIAFEQLALHNEIIDKFKKSIRSALALPLLTLLFFILIMLGIFTFIVPRFEGFFESFKIDLPSSTKLVLYISRIIRSKFTWYILSGLILLIILTKTFLKKVLSSLKDKFILYIPIISRIYKIIFITRFLQTLSMLLKSGMHLAKALNISAKTVSNKIFQKDLETIFNSVESGKSLNSSIDKSRFLKSSDLISLITIGESSGNLSLMVSKAADIYQKRVYDNIDKFVSLAQPALLIILGLLIALLIFSVYIPIFTLSSIIN